jgi:hypothetical protein
VAGSWFTEHVEDGPAGWPEFGEYDGYDDARYVELGRLVVSWSRVEYHLKDVLARLARASTTPT